MKNIVDLISAVFFSLRKLQLCR